MVYPLVFWVNFFLSQMPSELWLPPSPSTANSSKEFKKEIHMKAKYSIRTTAILVAFSCTALAAPVTQNIKLDNFGYRPSDPKVAIFTANPGATVQIRNTSDTVVYTIPNNGGSITSMGADGQPSGD